MHLTHPNKYSWADRTGYLTLTHYARAQCIQKCAEAVDGRVCKVHLAAAAAVDVNELTIFGYFIVLLVVVVHKTEPESRCDSIHIPFIRFPLRSNDEIVFSLSSFHGVNGCLPIANMFRP